MTDQRLELQKKVHPEIRICINCGNTKVQVYGFGISCSICGTNLYFGRTK